MQMRLVRKIMAIVLVVLMSLGTPLIASAKTQEYNSDSSIEEFFCRNDDGTMTFDEIGAENAGFSCDYIKVVKNNVAIINECINNGDAVLSGDYSVTIYPDNSKRSSGRMLRAVRGQSKVVMQATGLVMVYMNSAEADDLYNTLGRLGHAYSIVGIIGWLTTAAPILSQACSMCSAVGYIQVTSYRTQIQQVRKSGRGIIMYVAPMPDGVNSSVWFGAQ